MRNVKPLDELGEALKELQETIAFVDLCTRQSGAGGFPELLLHRRGHVALYLYKESGTHKRPHFHIRFKTAYDASYEIESGERLAGTMPVKYERPILDWVKKNRDVVSNRWHRLNSDERMVAHCPADETTPRTDSTSVPVACG